MTEKSHRMKYDVIIVGAGAAGLMAAGVAASNGKSTLLIDKNKVLGRKLRITGKGRCNVTNNCQPEKVIESTPGNGRFLYSAVNSFTPADTMAHFEELSVPLKTERGNRVFPVSDKADDIADALKNWAKAQGAATVQGKVISLLCEGGTVTGVKTADGIYQSESVILACGGASYPGTGSDGGGYKLARAAGHTVTPIVPSLVPLVSKGSLCSRLQGLSLRNCGIKVFDNSKNKFIYEDFGELLFTHFGLSGPTILSASAHMRGMESGKYSVLIDLKPALDDKTLDGRLLRDFKENQNKAFHNSLDKLLPKSLIPVVVELSGIDPLKQCNNITKEERRALCSVLKSFKIDIEGFRPINEAIVTSGGVNVKEINPKTMESKLVKGLFFAGEMMDVDAYTGGFNLQIAFSTAYCAAKNAAWPV